MSYEDQSELAARTIPGLHGAVADDLGRFVASPAAVLDLGAGTGAWAAKLISRGYSVTCVDRDGDNFLLKGVRFINADLDKEFAALIESEFSIVTAIEVIEHLENPRHFLRQCYKLLAIGGILLITTPNIEGIAGRLRFLLSGNFRMFDRDESFNDPTHISPIQTFMFEKMVRDTGLKIIFHGISASNAEISTPLHRLLCSMMGPFVSGAKSGDNHIYILAKAKSNVSDSSNR
jgi:2-polyprenyl-3-methyl-5-hydroxy-6-metoxy-1,4-benzoquinol methylase